MTSALRFSVFVLFFSWFYEPICAQEWVGYSAWESSHPSSARQSAPSKQSSRGVKTAPSARPIRLMSANAVQLAEPQSVPAGFGSPGYIEETTSCCPEFWEHRTGLFGDFLYLTLRETDFAYATHVDGLLATSVPLAPSNIVDPDYQPGFRIGGSLALDSCSSIAATYWYSRSTTTDSLTLPGGTGFIRSEVTHPNTANVAADSLAARASYDTDFQMVDLTYKSLLSGGCCHAVNYSVGIRYAHLDQQFHGEYSILGATSVDSDINFDGIGLRLGIEGERLLQRGFFVYGQAFADLLAGEFKADYIQRNAFVGVQARTGVEDDRIVPQLELELGVGWQSCGGRFRVRGGYYLGSWFNSMTAPTWIGAVRANSLSEIEERLTIDGLTLRAEYLF